MMSADYWLGVLTPLVLAAVVSAMVWLYFRLATALLRCGWIWRAKWTRDLSTITDYGFQEDIWWERQRGPIFTGHWYRVEKQWGRGDRDVLSRWLGIGRADGGPCFMVFKVYDPAPSTTPEAGGSR